MSDRIQDFTSFIKNSTSAYGTVCEMKERLMRAGFLQISEQDSWQLYPGEKYFVVRNDSSLIAFCMPDHAVSGFHMVCAHSDSPSFKLKENPEIKAEGGYLKLNVEKYGGMMMESWFDRPLSAAGRVVVQEKDGQLKSVPVDFGRPMFLIPSLAIHMKRGTDADKELNPQLHLLPIAGTDADNESFMETLAQLAGVQKDDILGMDLYLYPVQEPVVLGLKQELIGSPRLDDLQCTYCGLLALLQSKADSKLPVLAVFDNEEVGSTTMQGAASDFLLRTLRRIAGQIAADTFDRLLAGSFLLSADNAHALHPNYAQKADPTNRPLLNGGVVIKYHGGQKYTTSAWSGAYIKALCRQEQIPYQTYQNRSDIAGGSTLGNIALTSVSVPAADIGIAQLAMHSAFEVSGIADMEAMEKLMRAFLSV